MALQEEVRTQVQRAETMIGMEEQKTTQLQVTNDTYLSELRVYQQQIARMQAAPNVQSIAELRDQLTQAQEWNRQETFCSQQLRTQYAGAEQQLSMLEGTAEVSGREYADCARSNVELTSQVARQEATIAHLRILTADQEQGMHAITDAQQVLDGMEREMEAESEAITQQQSLAASEQLNDAQAQADRMEQ